MHRTPTRASRPQARRTLSAGVTQAFLLRPHRDPDPERQIVLPLLLGHNAADRQLALVERAGQIPHLRLDRPACHATKPNPEIAGRPPLTLGAGEVERVSLEPAAHAERRLEMRSGSN